MDGFNVTTMLGDLVDQDSSAAELFLKKSADEDASAKISDEPSVQPASGTGWMPDAKLLRDMPELTAELVTYDESEIVADDESGPLRNLMDDDAAESGSEQKDEMVRIHTNIADAKHRFGILKLQIPRGPLQVAVITAASDADKNAADEKLDKVFNDMITTYPEFILEWDPESEYNPQKGSAQFVRDEENVDDTESAVSAESAPVEADTQVIIDKSNLQTVSWTDADLDKLRKARTVELNIVEGRSIEMGEIIEPSDRNVIDHVISTYMRKNNDAVISLPASRYRCTIRGLSYPEVLDLSTSTEMNNIDAERKKWSIAFSHISNMSIGPWDEYLWYLDPVTRQVVKQSINSKVPDEIDPDDVHYYTAFEDFLRKTSYLDLNYIIWKIICVTCMDTEIIQIDCNASLDTGGRCSNHYDWIYSPAELLEMDHISDVVLEEMKQTGEATGFDVIQANYQESFLNRRRTVKLTDSGLYVVFGHISAYKYLEEIYPALLNLKSDDVDPVSAATKSLHYSALTVIQEILAPTDNGYVSIHEVDDMMKIISNMSEIDWQSIGGIVRLATEPYTFKYSLRGLVCPKCKRRSKINIDNLYRLLFIVARSLSSVRVEFKTN